jgi:hypothetical protein
VKRLFGAYVAVDWSAAEGRKTGENSVWIGVAKRDARFRLSSDEPVNPPTRVQAFEQLRTILADLKRRGDKVLLGFDFGLGLPAGTAERLKLSGEPWSALWTFLAKEVVDKADGTNNRFQTAAKMNRLMTGEAWPYWGAPARFVQTTLKSTKPVGGYGDIAEFRAAEAHVRAAKTGPAKSQWQLSGAGAVGGQTLMGVPYVKRLSDELGARAGVWPFQTGWRLPERETLDGLDVLIAEIYPSLHAGGGKASETKDAAQVRLTCEHFARLDEAGKLGELFAPPKGVSPETVAAVEAEEGWILGA